MAVTYDKGCVWTCDCEVHGTKQLRPTEALYPFLAVAAIGVTAGVALTVSGLSWGLEWALGRAS